MLDQLKNLFGIGTTTPPGATPPAGAPPNGDFSLTPAQPDLPSPPAQPSAVQTPYKTSLRLTPEQESRLVDRCLQRIEELRREMGLTVTNDIIANSWISLRYEHEQSYLGDYSWRLSLGSIFGNSNFTLGSGMRHTRYLASRIQDDLLGTSPFFAALSWDSGKEELAKQVEELVQQKIEGTNLRKELRAGQKIALIRNEVVVKTSYVIDASPYLGPATVYVDQFTNQPILTPTGLYVYKDEQWLPSPTTQGMLLLARDPGQQATPGQTPAEMIFIQPDPDTGVPVQIIGVLQEIDDLPQTLTKYDGVKCDVIDYRSFLCPLKVRSIHDADINVHLLRETPNRLRAMYGNIDIGGSYFSWWDGPGEKKPKYEQGEIDEITSVVLEEVQLAECFIRFDADGDNVDEEIFLVLDLRNQKPIYYNYLANHFPRRPFDVIPGLELIPNRWYGRGIFGMCEDQLLYEDAQWNRINYKDSKEASMTFAYKEACDDWSNGVAPVIGDKSITWIKSGWDKETKPPIFRVRMAEDVENGHEMMELARQATDGIIGSISVKDASTSDMNQSKTATGVVNLQQASDAITKATEVEQTEAIDSILALAVDQILEHMDQTVMLATGKDQLAVLNRDECRNLTRDVRLLLTRSKSTQLLQVADSAIQVGVAYRQMMLQDPEGAKVLRPLFLDKLKALEVDDADEVIPEITDEMIQAFQQQQQAAAQAAQQPKTAAETISTKYTDLMPSEQAQVLHQEGIQPAAANEVAAVQAQRSASEAAKQPPQKAA